MSISEGLQHLCALEKSSPEFIRALYTFIRLDEKGEHSLNLQQSESAQLVNLLDGALDFISVTDPLFRRCLRRLRHICGHHNVLPSSHIISDGLRKTSDNPVAYGGFADVWEGKLGDERVCIKVLRVYNMDTNNQKGSLVSCYGEAVVWKRLRHPNVVPFLGVTMAPLQLVSKWMPNGTLTEYVNSNPGVDRISLLLDVAEGINYLHTCYMLHGDLKGPNVLIDGNGHARISDFGLTSIAHGIYSTGIKSDKGHTVRWSAPEVLFGDVPASKQADIFAFGMVVVEAFTGNVPFHNTISTAVTFMLMNGERPPRPLGGERLGLSDPLWKMADCCWQQSPEERLKAPEVVGLLREMYVGSPSNSFIGAINGTRGLVGSSPMILQTDAALSPRLLEILQYHEPTHKRALSDTTPLNDDRRTIVNSLPASTVGYQIPRQHAGNGIIQRLGATEQGRNDPPIPFPARPETPDAFETDVFWSASPAIPHHENLNRVPKPGGSTLDPPEPLVTIPKISVPPDGPSSTVVDGSESQHPAWVGGTGTNRRVRDTRNSHGVDGRNDHGASDSRNGRRDSRTRKVSNAGPGKTGPQHGQPGQRTPTFSLRSIQQPPSRSNSTKKKGLGPLAKLGVGSGGSRPSTRSTTPTAERTNNPKSQERGRDISPQQTGAAKKGPSRWGGVRAMVRVIGLSHRIKSSKSNSNETGE